MLLTVAEGRRQFELFGPLHLHLCDRLQSMGAVGLGELIVFFCAGIVGRTHRKSHGGCNGGKQVFGQRGDKIIMFGYEKMIPVPYF